MLKGRDTRSTIGDPDPGAPLLYGPDYKGKWEQRPGNWDSPFGKALQAIRDNETRAEFVGVQVRRYRLVAFVVSGIYTGSPAPSGCRSTA